MKRLLIVVMILLAIGCSVSRIPPAEGFQFAETRGQQTWMRYCNSCHPQGMGGLGPSIIDKPLPGFLIRRQVRWGIGTMPSFSREAIDTQEMDHLIAFIREMKQNR